MQREKDNETQREKTHRVKLKEQTNFKKKIAKKNKKKTKFSLPVNR